MMQEIDQRTIVKKQSKLVALIDEETCTGCEVCIEFCPADCIILLPNPNPELRNNVCRDVEADCTGCTLCAKECPWECISMVPRERGQIANHRWSRVDKQAQSAIGIRNHKRVICYELATETSFYSG